LNHHFLDRYSRLESRLHRLPAAGKMLGALAIVLATVLAPPNAWIAFALTGIILLGLAILSGVPIIFLFSRLLLIEPVVLGVAILSLWQPNGGRIFALILTKSTLCLFTMILLANTTSFAAMLAVLRRAHFPPILVTTLALMYRYLFVLAEETERMKRARQSRTFSKCRGLAWRSLATVIGQLFVRSTERAERIYAAMCARGWR
jgi:cobalt/nickel transport system permease protein